MITCTVNLKKTESSGTTIPPTIRVSGFRIESVRK
jgi:hypothetical protein